MFDLKILITGGAGYVGAVLVPTLLDEGYQVTVIDLMIYGEDVLEDHPKLQKVSGDIRDLDLMKTPLKVRMLSCIWLVFPTIQVLS